MQRIIFTSFQCFCLFLILSNTIHARPNPVPNDDISPEKELQRYEKEGAPTAADRLIHPHHRAVRAPEDPDDLEVINELPPPFKTVKRRNRDIYPVRRNIFQYYIDNWTSSETNTKLER